MFTIFKGNDRSPIDAVTLQQILDDVLSPRLERHGLTKQADYLWHEPAVKQIRKGFSYSLLKGAQGTFTWGVNLDILPMIAGGKVVYHRSARKYVHHLFEWTEEYAGSFSGGQLAGGVISHVGLQETKRSIAALFDRYEPNIVDWLDAVKSVDNCIDVAERQMRIGKAYSLHHPRPAYVLAFLYAMANQPGKATALFDSLDDIYFNNNAAVKEKLRAKLLGVKG